MTDDDGLATLRNRAQQTTPTALSSSRTEPPHVKNLESIRKAVVLAIRDVAPEDLDAEVASFDLANGLYRIESKVKIHTGQIVSMAVERDFNDFLKVRKGVLLKIDGDPEAEDLALAKLLRIPRKRLRSVLRATAANVFKGKRKGELNWQRKQVLKLDQFLASAVDFVTLLKQAGTNFESNHFSFVSGFGRFEVEDFLLCFLCQGAFFTGILTIDVPPSSNDDHRP